MRFASRSVLLVGVVSVGCGSSANSPPLPDARLVVVDAPPPDAAPTSINDLPVSEEVKMAGLSAPVDVVRDVRGIPHIYGASIADVVRVQGYLMARDRFPQM